MSDISNNVTSNEYVDKITLELLMNKPHYNKYLESTDPKMFEKKKAYINEVKKYKSVILDIIEDEFKHITNINNSSNRTKEISDSFNAFVKPCIKYIKSKETETKNPFNQGEPDEELFENCDPIEQKIKENALKDLHYFSDSDSNNDDDTTESKHNSLWGEGAVKSSTSYDIRMFGSKKKR
jgi:hypothetical protein